MSEDRPPELRTEADGTVVALGPWPERCPFSVELLEQAWADSWPFLRVVRPGADRQRKRRKKGTHDTRIGDRVTVTLKAGRWEYEVVGFWDYGLTAVCELVEEVRAT